ncbi:MAG: hypothetical protein DHS20C15_25910 [Planctomycetota bacterium]|nr:MAG: hypothetical protein DHS20C15_25910 [Planctomycetota bacterium]
MEAVQLSKDPAQVAGLEAGDRPALSAQLRLLVVDEQGFAVPSARAQWMPWSVLQEGASFFGSPVDARGVWSAEVAVAEIAERGRIEVRAEGYAPEHLQVPALLPGSHELGRVALSRLRVVRGRVLDAARHPVQDASVSPIARTTQGPYGALRRSAVTVQTNAGGEFTVELLPHDETFTSGLRAWSTERASYLEVLLPAHAAEHGVLELEFPPAAPLSGSVRDRDGPPIEGAHVEARIPFGPVIASTRSDAEGRFQLGVSSTHPVIPLAEAEGYQRLGSEPDPIGLPAHDVDLRLVSECERSVFAVDADSGESLHDFRVSLCVNDGASSTCHEIEAHEGEARIVGLACGDWRQLEVTAAGYWPSERSSGVREPHDPPDPLVLALRPRGDLLDLAGRVQHAHGEPAARAEVAIFDAADKQRTPVATVTSNPLGEYALSDLVPGEYELAAQGADGSHSAPTSFTLDAEHRHAPLLTLLRGARVGGSVRAEVAELAANVILTLRPSGPRRDLRPSRSTLSNATGGFEFEAVAAGRYQLDVWRREAGGGQTFEAPSRSIELTNGESRQLDVPLTVRRVLEVTLAPRPADATGWSAELSRLSEPPSRSDWPLHVIESFTVEVDAEGRFTIHSVAPADYRLTVTDGNGKTQLDQELEVLPSVHELQRTTLNLQE